MLMRRATTYSSFCPHVVLINLQPFRRNSLLKCAPRPKIAKISLKPSHRKFNVVQSHQR